MSTKEQIEQSHCLVMMVTHHYVLVLSNQHNCRAKGASFDGCVDGTAECQGV